MSHDQPIVVSHVLVIQHFGHCLWRSDNIIHTHTYTHTHEHTYGIIVYKPLAQINYVS